jgi:hypothetical protein
MGLHWVTRAIGIIPEQSVYVTCIRVKEITPRQLYHGETWLVNKIEENRERKVTIIEICDPYEDQYYIRRGVITFWWYSISWYLLRENWRVCCYHRMFTNYSYGISCKVTL